MLAFALPEDPLFNVSAIPSFQQLLFDLASYVSINITPSSVSGQQAVLQAIQQTLTNALHLWDAYQIQSLLAQEYTLLNIASTLNISPVDLQYIDARIASFKALYQSVYPLNVNVSYNINNLTNGAPALPAYDLLSYFVQFDSEILPLTLTTSNFQSTIQTMATAWQDAYIYLNQGNGTLNQQTSILSVNKMADCCLDIVNFVSNLTLDSSITNLNQIWNSIVALPTMLRYFSLVYQDPSSQASQSINAIKFVMLNLLLETNATLAAFSTQNKIQTPTQATLRASETLMDFAARTTGDFSQWSVIAQANKLVPPYTGIIPAPGIAVPGTKLYLPPYSSNSIPVGEYENYYLGIDWDFGYPYTTLDTWNGDFSMVSGISNYTEALARRVLTPLGSLIYHTNYGSQLPAEIGNVQTAQEAALQLSYLKNALLSDPRTQSIARITAYPVKFGDIVLTSAVIPYGLNQLVPFNLLVVPVGSQVITSAANT